MLSNKDIRVENGNLIINGVKYPLDTIEIREEVDALAETVGDETSGLVKDVNDLSETVGDSESGLVKAVDDLDTGKIDSILSADSESALAVGDTFQIPEAMLERDVIIICFNRAAWCGSVTVFTNLIKGGDTATGLKIVSGDKTNPTVDKYIIFDISATGLLTIDYINNWSAPYVKVRAL